MSHRGFYLAGLGGWDVSLSHNYRTGKRPLGVSFSDFNNDHFLDLLVINGEMNTITVFLGNGDGTFQEGKDSGGDAGPNHGVAQDFDGDKISGCGGREYSVREYFALVWKRGWHVSVSSSTLSYSSCSICPDDVIYCDGTGRTTRVSGGEQCLEQCLNFPPSWVENQEPCFTFLSLMFRMPFLFS